mmetsp:Transcript_12957/g.17764  ORF Transcript_12957/g.17764 Transcript_12957/m.17764 type:complete len:194 (-) Transcript_12957:123-704(-)
MRAMEDFLDSGVMNSWPNAIRTYSAAVTINERQEVAKATLNVVAYIACYGTVIRNRLINVPDLFASLADLCKEEVLLLQGNYQMLFNIKSMVHSLTYHYCFSEQANVLMEANWTAFVVRSLKASINYRDLVINFIDWFVVHIRHVCKMTLKSTGVEKVLEEVIQKYPDEEDNVNSWSRKALRRLKGEEGYGGR